MLPYHCDFSGCLFHCNLPVCYATDSANQRDYFARGVARNTVLSLPWPGTSGRPTGIQLRSDNMILNLLSFWWMLWCDIKLEKPNLLSTSSVKLFCTTRKCLDHTKLKCTTHFFYWIMDCFAVLNHIKTLRVLLRLSRGEKRVKRYFHFYAGDDWPGVYCALKLVTLHENIVCFICLECPAVQVGSPWEEKQESVQ